MTVPVVRFTFRDAANPVQSDGDRLYTVIYDGDCRVCAKMVRVLRAWDRRGVFAILPFQDPSVPPRFPWISPAAFREAMQVIARDGTTWAGAAALEQILGLLPAGWLFGWAFRVPVLGTLLDRFYRWFARNRYHFGCGEHCTYQPGGTGA